jgi:hypothetical protein
VDEPQREHHVTTSRRRGRTGLRRLALTVGAVGLTATVLVGEGGVDAARADGNGVARRDASTGWITDVSPSQVATVVDVNGQQTVFVRGTDGEIWYRTDVAGTWNAWARIPASVGATSGPGAVSVEGNFVYLVVRGGNGAVYLQSAMLGANGPVNWSGSWGRLGGSLTSAPTIATGGDGSLSVVGRGGDGAVWQILSDRTHGWSQWVSLGGYAFSAPAIEADEVAGAWRYMVYVVGTDLRVWHVPATADPLAAGDHGSWYGGSQFSGHGLGSINTSADWSYVDTLLSAGGGDHSVFLVDPADGWAESLGGRFTSTAAIAGDADGNVRVYARGGDNALWYTVWDGQGGPYVWTSLGGQLA